MAATIPSAIPESFVIGTTVQWTDSLSDYPASDGWALQHTFVQAADQQQTTAAAYNTDDFLTTLTAAESALFTAGTYFFQSMVTKAAETYLVKQGRIEVKAGFATEATGYDNRSHVLKVLDALETALEGRASEIDQSFSIGTGEESRSVSKMSLEELMAARSTYLGHLREIDRKERVEQGLDHEDNIYTRFV